jgi:hypothetical protein
VTAFDRVAELVTFLTSLPARAPVGPCRLAVGLGLVSVSPAGVELTALGAMALAHHCRHEESWVHTRSTMLPPALSDFAD